MTKNKALAVAEKLFPNYPKTENFYITSDGFSFLSDTDAQAHAKKLKDNTVISISRADVEAQKAKEVEAKDGAKKEAATKEAASKKTSAKSADANTQTSKTDN